MKDLVTRAEAQAIWGIKNKNIGRFWYKILKNGIKPAVQENRNGRIFNLYYRHEIEALKKGANK